MIRNTSEYRKNKNIKISFIKKNLKKSLKKISLKFR